MNISEFIIITMLTIFLIVYFSNLHENIHVKICEYFNVRAEKVIDILRFEFYTKMNQYDLKELSENERIALMQMHSINEISQIFIPFFVIVIILLVIILMELIEMNRNDKKRL